VALIDRIVIVGAGHAGTTAAALLRTHGYQGEIVVLSGEPHLPYDRPPLSKALFKGTEPVALLPAGFYAERDIDLRLGAEVVAIDRAARSVELADGSRLDYDRLILATGAVARKLLVPGADLDRVYELRTLDDARRLEEQVGAGSRIAIVGGGWIGLEAAAAAIAAGHEPTVIEREDRLLARVASRELSGLLADLHRERGTRLIVGVDVVALEGSDGGVDEVVLADGMRVPCDHALIGIGAVADDALAAAAGLRCEGGVVVDENGATEDPCIYAIGDVSRRPLGRREGLFRLESIPSAQEQARRVVGELLGAGANEPEVPWFWSDQLGLKIQIAGLLVDAEEAIVCGDMTQGPVAICHLSGRRLVCIEAVDATPWFNAGKASIAAGGEFDPAAFGAAPAVEAPADSPPPAAAAVSYLQPDGSAESVEVPIGSTLMDAAIGAGIAGIIAECGGGCACGTCHVFVADDQLELLTARSQAEIDMLEFVEGARPNSRLSCQLVMTPELDGLVLTVPEEQ
jgi:3-phenylpropionate/trans-cinnamate dioxygenase ferredoxin reductase subunit